MEGKHEGHHPYGGHLPIGFDGTIVVNAGLATWAVPSRTHRCKLHLGRNNLPWWSTFRIVAHSLRAADRLWERLGRWDRKVDRTRCSIRRPSRRSAGPLCTAREPKSHARCEYPIGMAGRRVGGWGPLPARGWSKWRLPTTACGRQARGTRCRIRECW